MIDRENYTSNYWGFFKITYNLWVVSLLSIFFRFTNHPYYVPFFLLFILLIFFQKLYSLKVKAGDFKIIICIGILWLGALLTIVYNGKTVPINNDFTSKLFINFSFLASSVVFISDNKSRIIQNVKPIKIMLEMVIFFSFMQMVLNVSLTNYWVIPFKGVSIEDAYLLSREKTYFGTVVKNIWSTKMAFFFIVYFTMVKYKVISISKIRFRVLMFMTLFCELYVTSRTGLLVYFTFLVLYLYSWYKNLRKRYRMVVSLPIFLSLLLSGLFIYQKLLRLNFDFNSSDGLMLRVMGWISLINRVATRDWINTLVGDGLGSATVYRVWPAGSNNLLEAGINNWHNVPLEYLASNGVIGLITFTAMTYFVFKKGESGYFFLLTFIPFFICIISQYIGIDNDIVCYLSLIYLLRKIKPYYEKEVKIG